MKKFKISNLERKIRNILEQDQNQESDWIDMTPEEFKTLMKFVNYHGNYISRIREYRNKHIRVDGTLNLENTPTTSLGPLRIVTGSLYLSHTNIKNLDNVKARYVNYYNTPLYREEERKRIQKLLDAAQERRDNDEWNIENTDELGEKANALFQYFIKENQISPKTDSDILRIQELENKLKELESKEKEYEEQGRNPVDLVSEIEVINDEMEELNKKIDVYNLSPAGKHWELQVFSVLDSEEISGSEEYAVGNQEDVDESALQYWKSLIDDDLDNFSERTLSYHIDSDSLRSTVEDDYEYDVRENPEIYLEESDKDLSKSQQSLINDLNIKKEALEEKLYNMDPDNDEYETTQDEITDIDNEIEEIEDSPEGDYKEDAIQDKIDSLVDEAVSDPIAYIKDRGLDLKNFVDGDSLAKELADNEGYGVLSSYDGNYDEININGNYYFILRVN